MSVDNINDIRPFEVDVYNPGIHELSGEYQNTQSGFRRVIAIGVVALAGLGLFAKGYSNNHQDESQQRDPQITFPEQATAEVANINTSLDSVQLGQANALDSLIQNIRTNDAVYATTDSDRAKDMPNGYVKFLLPNEEKGIKVPFTVAERTADIERYTSPELSAVLLATAKIYQDLIFTKYPQLAGEMLRIRDLNSPFHKNHSTGTQADISSMLGWQVAQYSNGSFADQQFSTRFNREFTIDLMTEMSRFTINGQPVIRRIVYSDEAINNAVNDRVGRRFAVFAKWHKDHAHLDLNSSVAQLPAWRPDTSQIPWNEQQDLRIGGMAQPISPEQSIHEHGDFIKWVASISKPDTNESETNLPHPDVMPLNPGAEELIDSLDISSEHKDYLKRMVPVIATATKAGAKFNPAGALAHSATESGWGVSDLSKKANNYFGLKAGKYWTGKTINLKTLEEYTEGNLTTIKDNFRDYDDPLSGVMDYARFIESRPWYADAITNNQTPKGYFDGLFHEIDNNGNILKRQGEGAISYGTSRGYVERAVEFTRQYNLEEIMNAQLGS